VVVPLERYLRELPMVDADRAAVRNGDAFVLRFHDRQPGRTGEPETAANVWIVSVCGRKACLAMAEHP
jgi:hypothetical protein